MVAEYLSFPITTVYTVEDKDMIPAPAFTVCPKMKERGKATGEMIDVSSLNLSDVVQSASYGWVKFQKSQTFMDENIFLQNGEYSLIFMAYENDRMIDYDV